MKLTVTPTTWAKGTSRFFARGRSAKLQIIDTALDDYDTAAKVDWSSAESEQALLDLKTAIEDWKAGKGSKSNGKIDSCRDSKRLVSDLLAEIPIVLKAIKDSPSGKQRSVKAMVDKSKALAKSKDVERSSGGEYEKTSSGKFVPKIYTQQQTNSCTCACACTFTTYLSDVALREDVFRAKYNEVVGPHNFKKSGSFFPEVARTLQALQFDATHVATGDWPDLKNHLSKATASSPVIFGITWDGDTGAHAILCKGAGTVSWTDDSGTAQSAAGFIVQDPWGTHKNALLFDDGGYWVFDTSSSTWQQGYADPSFGFIWGKRSASRGSGPKILSQGVKLPGM